MKPQVPSPESMSKLGRPRHRLKKGERWVWLRTYGGFCLRIIMRPSGQLVDWDGGSKCPYHICWATFCPDVKHEHHAQTVRAVDQFVKRAVKALS